LHLSQAVHEQHPLDGFAKPGWRIGGLPDIGFKEAPFRRTGDPIHGTDQQGQLLILGLGHLAAGSAPLGLDRLPEDGRIHAGEGTLQPWVELQGSEHILLRFNQLQVVLEFGDTLGQGVGFLRQGDHRDRLGEVGVGGGTHQEAILGGLAIGVASFGVSCVAAQPGCVPLAKT
jgi:hypothetical protein